MSGDLKIDGYSVSEMYLGPGTVDVTIDIANNDDVDRTSEYIRECFYNRIDKIATVNVVWYGWPTETNPKETMHLGGTVAIQTSVGMVYLRLRPMREAKPISGMVDQIARTFIGMGMIRLPGSRKKPNDFYLINPANVTEMIVNWSTNVALLRTSISPDLPYRTRDWYYKKAITFRQKTTEGSPFKKLVDLLDPAIVRLNIPRNGNSR